MANMISEMVLVNQMWPRLLKIQMTDLAARKGVSVAELTRRAVQAQYAAELAVDMPETAIEANTTWRGELR